MDRLRIRDFGSTDGLESFQHLPQGQYLRRYLADLSCATVVEEPFYFDRDYLAEFAAFYARSSQNYGNRCRRLHFFGGKRFDRTVLKRALEGSRDAKKRLDESYLGFSIIRPIPVAPFGRTVLRWYPDPTPSTPRRTARRQYVSHLAGLKLTVDGIAWQQQDTGVGACATVAIWSMLHSSAFDPHYLVPTTAEITRSAHKTASLGSLVFPSVGLTIFQLLEAIKEFGLNPFVIDGDLVGPKGERGFTPGRFSSFCAAMIRSGYPVLIIGDIPAGGHAICGVGFREVPAPTASPGQIALEDARTRFLYVHDDNIGPNIKCDVRTSPSGVVELHPSAPTSYGGAQLPNPTSSYGPFIPRKIVGGVHADLRISLLALHTRAIDAAAAVQRVLLINGGPQMLGLTLSIRFEKLSSYMADGLAGVHRSPSKALGRTRLALQETVAPMSLRVGVVRLGVGSTPLLDILFDTSDSERQLAAFCTVSFHKALGERIAKGDLKFDFGAVVHSY